MRRLAKRETTSVMTPARKRVLAALLAAVLIHLILLLVVAALVPLFPKPVIAIAKRDKPIKMTIERPEESSAAEEKKKLEYLETHPDQESEIAPDKPAFESNQNSLAASERPGEEGKEPLPTQEGKELPFFKFNTQPYVEGDKPTVAAAERPDAAPVPTPVPESTPAPLTAPPRPQPDLTSTRPTLAPRQLAMLAPQTTPLPTGPDSQQKQPDPRPTVKPLTSSPASQARPGYQPESIKTKMLGGVSNQGRDSAATIGTPLGRYQKIVNDAIGIRWYFLYNKRVDLVTYGTTKVFFLVNREGQTEQVRVVSNSSNETLAAFSVQSISEAKLPPIPSEVSALLPGGKLEFEFTFTIH